MEAGIPNVPTGLEWRELAAACQVLAAEELWLQLPNFDSQFDLLEITGALI